jgi:hypothetical protein
MALEAKCTDRIIQSGLSEMSDVYDRAHGCASSASKSPFADVPLSNGKTQPWMKVWPPRRIGLEDVAESQGQMLLLDGTGGSGTKAVPNAVYLPPKPDRPQSDKEDSEEKKEPKIEDSKSGK